MYLQTYLDRTNINISQYALENTTYSAFYYFWRDELFERCMKLFKEDTGVVPPHEVEVRLIIQGHCAIAPLNYELTAFFGQPNGIAKYRDRLPFYCVHSPVWSGNLKVGEFGMCEVIYNNKIANPLLDLIHHYAILLAHCEVTFVDECVNARMGAGIPVATTEKQKRSIKQFLANVFNGRFDTVTDIGNLGLNYAGAHLNVTEGVEALWNARRLILCDFLERIGVKTGLDKRSNTTSDEVNANTPALLINLEDMLESRQEGFERVNKHWGVKWSIELNDNINYINEFTNPKVDIGASKEVDENEKS